MSERRVLSTYSIGLNFFLIPHNVRPGLWRRWGGEHEVKIKIAEKRSKLTMHLYNFFISTLGNRKWLPLWCCSLYVFCPTFIQTLARRTFLCACVWFPFSRIPLRLLKIVVLVIVLKIKKIIGWGFGEKFSPLKLLRKQRRASQENVKEDEKLWLVSMKLESSTEFQGTDKWETRLLWCNECLMSLALFTGQGLRTSKAELLSLLV